MPEMDGIQFLGCIAEKAYKGSVVITSAASTEVISTVERMCQSYRLNILGCLPKPASIDELSEMVELARKHMLSEQRPVAMLTAEDVKTAYLAGWIKPWYQPIVSLEDGHWVANEALLRLEHPEHGVIPPGAFLRQMEEAGLEAAQTLNNIRITLNNRHALAGRRTAINITPMNLVSEGFVDEVIQIIDQTPDFNDHIYFEITESNQAHKPGQALEAASRLSMHGCKLSIDDFGTGYSSLKQLESLPFESLKIDKDFVQSSHDSKASATIIEACLLLTKRLSLKAVAEGVETESHWWSLRSEGCDMAQGYFVGRPMPVAELAAWHQQWIARNPCARVADGLCCD